jgi:phenylacetate-CoA ligase
MLSWLSGHVVYPLQDLRDPHHRLASFRKLKRTQWLPPNELHERQMAALRRMLVYAGTYSSFYQQRFAAAHIDPATLPLPEGLSRIPLLSKDDVRANTSALCSRTFTRESLKVSRTGGSTGTALELYFDEACQALRNAAAMRSDGWAGWRPGMERAAIWGNPKEPDTVRGRLRMLFYDRFTSLDTMNMSAMAMLRFYEYYQQHRPPVIFGHSHSIYVLALFLRERRLVPAKPRGIISTSMTLLQPEREVIEQVFACPVSDRYGCEEVGLIAAQCEQHEGLHLNADHLVVEFLNEAGEPVQPGEEGRIVVTDLINHGMPLIRYVVGDLGVPSDRPCACGRGLPVMARVTGRVADFLLREDGSLVAGVSLIERTLTAIPGLKQMQLVQDQVDALTVNLVSGREYGAHSESLLRDELQSAFGPSVRVSIRLMSRIPQERSGKYRFAICRVKDALPGDSAARVSAAQ